MKKDIPKTNRLEKAELESITKACISRIEERHFKHFLPKQFNEVLIWCDRIYNSISIVQLEEGMRGHFGFSEIVEEHALPQELEDCFKFSRQNDLIIRSLCLENIIKLKIDRNRIDFFFNGMINNKYDLNKESFKRLILMLALSTEFLCLREFILSSHGQKMIDVSDGTLERELKRLEYQMEIAKTLENRLAESNKSSFKSMIFKPKYKVNKEKVIKLFKYLKIQKYIMVDVKETDFLIAFGLEEFNPSFEKILWEQSTTNLAVFIRTFCDNVQLWKDLEYSFYCSTPERMSTLASSKIDEKSYDDMMKEIEKSLY